MPDKPSAAAKEPVLRKRRTEGRERLYSAQRRIGWLVSILVALLAVCAVFLLWCVPVPVRGGSMTAIHDGDIVLCDRLAKYWKTPARGDMVLFTTADGQFIKRIVGLPGERVEVFDGYVYIDSCPLDESGYAVGYAGSAGPVTVPEGSVFVLGDDRAKVYDSRLPSVGCIPYSSIEGAVRFWIYPINALTYLF